jgi:site-specific DNA-cytosine methylase
MIDTFSGIGGFSLAARWLGGIETVQFVEREPYCRHILRKHWPDVPIHDDITTYQPQPGSADVICGGFPCQDISTAGKQAGIKEGTRSGLFYELMRVVRLVGPRYVVLENVAAITSNGLDAVLGTLAEAGFDAEWACIPAADVGACHRRDRWWCVAYASGADRPRWGEGAGRRERSAADAGRCGISEGSGSADSAANSDHHHVSAKQQQQGQQWPTASSDGGGNWNAPHSEGSGRRTGPGQGTGQAGYQGQGTGDGGAGSDAADAAADTHHQRQQERQPAAITSGARWTGWGDAPRRLNPDWRSYLSQPVLCRGDDGLSGRVDRLKALGNAVVPQVAMVPLQRVLELEAAKE